MKNKSIILVFLLFLFGQVSIAQKFPMPNQNVKDAFSLAGSIFTSYQGQKNYQNNINAIVKINTTTSDPDQLVREYTAKMNQLQKEADQRKQQKAAELEKQIDLIKRGLDEALKAADVDLGPFGNLAKDAIAGAGKQIAIANANKKIEVMKIQAEKELDEEMKKSMGVIYNKVVKENQDAQKEYLLAAAEVFSDKEERNYIDYFVFFDCILSSMKQNYDYRSAGWLKTACKTPPKSFFGYSQQAPRFNYSQQADPYEQTLEPNFAEFAPKSMNETIEKKLQESLRKVDDLISKTKDAFQKVEYMSLRQELIEKANQEKELVKTGGVPEPEPEPIFANNPKKNQYQPLLDCAIRKLALYKSEMPFPEFLESAKKYAEAEIAENKRNPNAYIFLADFTTDVTEQYTLMGYALYLDAKNHLVAEKFNVAKEKFGKALYSAIENGDIDFVNTALNKNLLHGFEHQGVTPFQFAIAKDNPDAMNKLMPQNTDKQTLLYYAT
ncbi:MAG: hypothetical protein RBR35_18040 [Salinivirgaceae bacterium]|nr:hypothetical protein [Salinivirgaceae bacterium]